jgi:hypothetical protein
MTSFCLRGTINAAVKQAAEKVDGYLSATGALIIAAQIQK